MRSFNDPPVNLRRPSGWIALAGSILLAFVYGIFQDDTYQGEDACCAATSDVQVNRGEGVGAAVAAPGNVTRSATLPTSEDYLRCAEERVRLAGAQMAHDKRDASDAERFREMSDAFRRDCPYNANAIGPANQKISDARRRELQHEGWSLFRD